MANILQRLQEIAPWRKSGERIEAEIKQLRLELSKRQERRKYLLSAPRDREEMIQLACGLIDQLGAGFEQRMKESSAHDLIDASKESIAVQSWAGPLLARRVNQAPSVEILQSNLCALLGPILKEAMRQSINQMDIICGPPAAEREAELKILGEEIGELERDIDDLRSELIRQLERARDA